MDAGPFRPALIVVDVQEDFCPPNGSLAVAEGRSVAAPINDLLKLPFVIRVATKDWHPLNHVSFATNHRPPENKPFVSTIELVNPENAEETVLSQLWPVHCVQATDGASLIPELDSSLIDHTVEKGQQPHLESYSAFGPPFVSPRIAASGLEQTLKDADATHVFVTGLAMDFCVKCTALDAAKAGFKTYVVRQATKAVNPGDWMDVENELADAGVVFVDIDGDEVGWVSDLR